MLFKKDSFKDIQEIKLTIPAMCAIALIILFMFLWGLIIAGVIN